MISPQTAPQHDDDRASALRRALWTVFAVALLSGALASGAQGADRWMSRPSYFSHQVPPHLVGVIPQPVSREAYRPAWVSARPGFSSAGAVRMNRVQFGAGGANDATLFYSERTEFGP
ncbi:hypothetical protein [Alienimonas californiensis]|uniref:Uncharacterized protein n=1 Tax=Alienimonas californiensis TaxID=2527989 RepID=A0A517P9Q2_9PLAN|nr:hypothetical protein [Alienimonas californiensis]QDT16100.1 hypothetical protein CA12_21980 [Alienimonas californiensis]